MSMSIFWPMSLSRTQLRLLRRRIEPRRFNLRLSNYSILQMWLRRFQKPKRFIVLRNPSTLIWNPSLLPNLMVFWAQSFNKFPLKMLCQSSIAWKIPVHRIQWQSTEEVEINICIEMKHRRFTVRKKNNNILYSSQQVDH